MGKATIVGNCQGKWGAFVMERERLLFCSSPGRVGKKEKENRPVAFPRARSALVDTLDCHVATLLAFNEVGGVRAVF
jgi:hypothetical protein